MAFNFALIADDAMDGYLQYQAAQKQVAADRKRKATVKVANFLEDNILHAMQNPRVLVPSAATLGLSATGIVASAYAPSWAGGPNEGEPQISPKRALKAMVAYNVLGNTILSTPENICNLISEKEPLARLSNATRLLPATAVAGSVALPLMRGEKPVGKDIVKNYRNASYVSGIGGFLHPQVLGKLDELVSQMEANA